MKNYDGGDIGTAWLCGFVSAWVVIVLFIMAVS